MHVGRGIAQHRAWLAALLILGILAVGRQPAAEPALSITVFGPATSSDPGADTAALDWLGLEWSHREALRAELSGRSVSILRLLVENHTATPQVVSEPHIEPSLELPV